MDTYHSPMRGLQHYDAKNLPYVICGMVLMSGLCAWLVWQEIWIFYSWRLIFCGLGKWLGYQTDVVLSHTDTLLVLVNVPHSNVSVGDSMWRSGLLGGILLAASFLLPWRYMPLRYLLRTLFFIMALSLIGYLLWGADRKIDNDVVLAEVFCQGYWFVVITPIFFALTAFTLPGNLVLRLGWVMLSEVYFLLIIPIVALFHWLFLSYFGPLVSPVLNTLGTLLLLSCYLIAFFGVAASVEE
ncbi:hypothetical protein CJR81_004109 [Salmonella enterica subsp. enterica serovar Javiana]|nr:hypothetical protein [Salmonella enterica]EDR1539082.1 hypothetical protein [Salmonella enterica subsp. enterica serovar Javiana]EIV1873167.1 hypothetical protein [Salmonella enterica]EKB2995432.1 hypothetical protein [Salmonella enterica]